MSRNARTGGNRVPAPRLEWPKRLVGRAEFECLFRRETAMLRYVVVLWLLQPTRDNSHGVRASPHSVPSSPGCVPGLSRTEHRAAVRPLLAL